MKFKTGLFYLLLGGLILHLGLFLNQNKSDYSPRFNPEIANNRYLDSRYVRGDKGDYILSDEELYEIEGYFLVGENRDLHQLTPGHPPLGKYLIGLSIKQFKNPYLLAPFFGLITLFLIYQVGLLLHLPRLLSLSLTILFSMEPLFLDQLATSLLDIYLLTFSLTSLYFYLLWSKRKHFAFILLSQITLGLAMATKFFPASFPLAGALLFSTVLTGQFSLFINHILALPFIFFGFSFGHLSYFFYHPSLLQFFRYQRYVLSWWVGSPQVPALQVWDLIFNNRWHTWWDKKEVIPTPFWKPHWPPLFALALASPLVLHLKKRLALSLPILLWVFFSLLLFSLEAVYPRHLLLILPAAYLLVGIMLNAFLSTSRLE